MGYAGGQRNRIRPPLVVWLNVVSRCGAHIPTREQNLKITKRWHAQRASFTAPPRRCRSLSSALPRSRSFRTFSNAQCAHEGRASSRAVQLIFARASLGSPGHLIPCTFPQSHNTYDACARYASSGVANSALSVCAHGSLGTTRHPTLVCLGTRDRLLGRGLWWPRAMVDMCVAIKSGGVDEEGTRGCGSWILHHCKEARK